VHKRRVRITIDEGTWSRLDRLAAHERALDRFSQEEILTVGLKKLTGRPGESIRDRLTQSLRATLAELEASVESVQRLRDEKRNEAYEAKARLQEYERDEATLRRAVQEIDGQIATLSEVLRRGRAGIRQGEVSPHAVGATRTQ